MIISAAIPEFAKHGFEGAVLNEICRKDEISKGRLFHHFKNKEELYIACLNSVIDKFVERNLRFSPDKKRTLQENLHDYFVWRHDFYIMNEGTFELLLQIQKSENHRFRNEFSELYEKAEKSNITVLERIFKSCDHHLKDDDFDYLVKIFYVAQSYALVNNASYCHNYSMPNELFKKACQTNCDIMDMVVDISLFGIYPRDRECPERMNLKNPRPKLPQPHVAF